MEKRFMVFSFLLLIGALLLSACATTNVPVTETPSGVDEPVNTEEPIIPDEPATPTKPAIPANKGAYEERVYVDSMQINLMESFPVQVSVTVDGNLPDGCTTIVESEAFMVDDSTFELHIYTERPQGVMCTQALVPFTESVTLDVYGLPAGTYTVNVYDLSDTFTLDVDNE